MSQVTSEIRPISSGGSKEMGSSTLPRDAIFKPVLLFLDIPES